MKETTDPALLEGFDRHLKSGGAAPGTVVQRLGDIRRLTTTHPNLVSITYEALERFFAERESNWSPNYRRRVLSSVIIFYRWAKNSKLIKRNPAKRLATFRVPRGIPRPAPDSIILDAFDQASLSVRAMICLGACAGLRRSEIAGTHPNDRDADRLRLIGKGNKARIIPLDPLTLSLLRDLESFQGKDVYYFPGGADGHLHPSTVYKKMKAVLGDWTPHTLRHRAGTIGLQKTRNLRAVQDFLGHASPDTTQIYTQVTAETLREVSEATSLSSMLARRRLTALLSIENLSAACPNNITSLTDAINLIEQFLRDNPAA